MNTIHFKSSRVPAVLCGVSCTAVTVLLLFSATPAMADNHQDEMQELRDRMQQIQQRMDEMTQRQQAVGTADTIAIKSPDDKGFMVGNTRVEINGYVKLDAVYDFEADHGVVLGPQDAIGTLRSEGTDRPGDQNIGLSVNQTRLKLATTTPTDFGDVGGYIEMDFFDNGDGFQANPTPRVRRAYLTVGNWLLGRDWTTFSDFNYGPTLNFYGPEAQIFERQAQIRYSLPVGEKSMLDIAIEEPGGGSLTGPAPVADGNGNFVGSDNTQNKAPDFVMRLKSEAGPVSFQVAGIARYLTADTGEISDASGNIVAQQDGAEESVLGWGLDVGATWALPTGTTLMGSVVGGKGIGKYIYAPAGGSDIYVKANGDVEAWGRYGFIATISQQLTSTLSGNVVYGKAYSEDPDDVAFDTSTLHDNSSTLAVNLLYTPVDPLTFGIQYNRANYEQQNRVDADANNVQFSTIYNF